MFPYDDCLFLCLAGAHHIWVQEEVELLFWMPHELFGWIEMLRSLRMGREQELNCGRKLALSHHFEWTFFTPEAKSVE